MSVCITIFWAIIMPIVTYGSELWVLPADETELLLKFQRYVCRRCQRFLKRSPNYSALLTREMEVEQFYSTQTNCNNVTNNNNAIVAVVSQFKL